MDWLGVGKGKDMHIIPNVEDNGAPKLPAYQRIATQWEN